MCLWSSRSVAAVARSECGEYTQCRTFEPSGSSTSCMAPRPGRRRPLQRARAAPLLRTDLERVLIICAVDKEVTVQRENTPELACFGRRYK